MNITTNANVPHVTILMLTYNRATFIREAIESALGQSYSNFTLVIIDDGSTDETPSLVATYHDNRIRYIRHEENAGLYARRRESLSYVTGTYAAILDSDDVWTDPEKLAAQVAYLEAHPKCVLVGTGFRMIDSAGVPGKEVHYAATDDAIRRRILIRQQFANSSILMRASALAETEGYLPYAPAEDYELCLQLGLVGLFANLPITALAYRVHGASATSKQHHHLRQIWRVVGLHRTHYPGAWLAYLKLCLLYAWSLRP